MNTRIPYELITQHIFQEILDQGTVRTIEVKHNITLQEKNSHTWWTYFGRSRWGDPTHHRRAGEGLEYSCRPGRTAEVSGRSR